VSDTDSRTYEPIRELKIADRQYDLRSRGKCSCCGSELYEIWRWAGLFFARYKMPVDFDCNDFENFVEWIDEQLLEPSHTILEDFYVELQRVNSPEGIEAEYSFSFKLIEYGRQRASALQKMSYFEALTSDKAPTEIDGIAVRTAFELGYAAGQHRMMVNYEDYVHDGMAMAEWRDAGLPKAREERLRQGARTRAEILKAAKRLYEEDPELVRNDSETARRIIKLRLPGLQKSERQQLGIDAITRHLRGARRDRKS
jgi:hypothetical protein